MEQNKFVEKEMYRRADEFIPKRYPEEWGGVAISELQPYHWTNAYQPEELEHYHK